MGLYKGWLMNIVSESDSLDSLPPRRGHERDELEYMR